MPKLSASAVQAIMMAVLFKEEEITNGKAPDNAVIVDGIMRKFAFHPERIAAKKGEIDMLLSDLPEAFRLSSGGGWSFLNGCMDKNDSQWGEQSDVEALVCLGIAAGSASWIMKDMANILPGGVPYFEVHPKMLASV